jgi:hypothetical protein
MALEAQGPFNYNTIASTQQLAPVQSFAGGVQAGQQMVEGQQKITAENQALTLQKQMMGDLSAVSANPTPQNIAALSIRYPQMADKFKQSYDMMNTQQQTENLNQAIPVYAALNSGHPETAISLLQQKVDAYNNAGQPEKAKALNGMIDTIKADPKHATVAMGMHIAAIMPDKFTDTFKGVTDANATNAKLPSEVALGAANAAIKGAEAGAAQQTVDLGNADKASIIAERKAKLQLERDTLKSNTQTKLEEIKAQYGDISKGPVATLINSSTEKSVAAETTASKFADFANKADNAANWTGFVGKGLDAWKHVLGSQDAVAELKMEYNRLRPSIVTGNIPAGAGPLSDKDIELYSQGIPEANANPKTIANFLRAAARMKHVEGTVEDAKAQWAAANQSLANAKTDTEINGVKVASGTSFKKFLNSYMLQDLKSYDQSLVDKRVSAAPYAAYLTTPNPAPTDEASAREMLKAGKGY